MTTSSTTRRALAAAAALATATCTLITAPTADAAQTRPGAQTAAATKKAPPRATKKTPARGRAAGFAPVRTLAGHAMAMTSPAKDQLWIAERTSDGKLLLEHKDGNRWRTYRMPIEVATYDDVELHGSASNDMWLVAKGTLWHRTSRNWTKVALPAGTRATAVYDLPGRDAYVGLDGDTQSTGIYRLRGARWIPLGRPVLDDEPYGPGWHPADLRVAGGTVFANWVGQARSAAHWENSFVLRGKKWENTFQTTFMGGGHYTRRGAWLVPDSGRQFSLGSTRTYGDLPHWTMCRSWTAKGGEGTCTTRWAVGAAALLPGGRIVVGGDDYQHPDAAPVQGTFGLRLPNGAERLIAGNPGDRTLQMTVEPGSNLTWAATQTGSVTTLQSWRG